jgi:Crp-like helix-turn-helix protein
MRAILSEKSSWNGEQPCPTISGTQAELGDALGLSTVHVNRTMKGLAREKLISYRNHSIAILDWEKLQTAGQFDASYLQWSDGNSRR